MPSYRLTTEKSWNATLDDLAETFRKWGVTRWSVEPIRPLHTIKQFNNTPQIRAVTLRYWLRDREVVLSLDEQARAHDNLRVLYLAAEALRLNELRGIASVVASAYLQLAPPARDDPYAILGVSRNDSLEVIEHAWKARLQEAHPDHGGSQDAAAPLNAAMAAIRKERGA